MAHELGPLAGLIERAVVLSHGHVVSDGPPPRRRDITRTRPTCTATRTPARSRSAQGWGWHEHLAYDFMRRALVAAVLVGLAAPVIETFLVQRRLSLMGDGVGHIALTGVALGFLLGTAPVLTATIVAIVGAVAIELVRER